MGKTYTASLELRNWKEHTCIGCGGAYTYLLVRKVAGTGASAEVAQGNLQKVIRNTLETATDMQPCPTCGLYQPDMIGRPRARKAWIVFWLALLASIITLILFASYAVSASTATWIMTAICGVAALRLLMIDMTNPNSNPEGNKMLAQQRVSAGEMKSTPGQAAARVDELANPGRTPMHLLALLILLAAVVPAAAPEIVRSSRGWVVNEQCYPAVVGPGDSTRVYMDKKISSVKGYWRGVPVASLHDAGAQSTPAIPVVATTNQNDWGHTIRAKSSEKSTSSTPWVTVAIPNNAALAGKTLKCDIDLDVEYPHSSGGSSFSRMHDKMGQHFALHLGPVGAGASFTAIWWQGTLAAIAMVLLGSLLMVAQWRSLQRRARPTRIVG